MQLFIEKRSHINPPLVVTLTLVSVSMIYASFDVSCSLCVYALIILLFE